MAKAALRQIITLGGGGFGSEPRNPRLDRYILNASGKKNPRICFLPTAGGDSRDYLRRFYRAFERYDCRPSDLTLFRRDQRDPAKHLLTQDVIFVGGGNTANALVVWKRHGVDEALRKAWRSGIILSGVSAGMICWFECCVTDSFGPLAPLREGLSLLPGSACPHYDGEIHRRPTYEKLIGDGFPSGVAADNGVALHFVGTKLLRCVCSRPHSHAYRVSKVRGKVVEEALTTRYLNRDGTLQERRIDLQQT